MTTWASGLLLALLSLGLCACATREQPSWDDTQEAHAPLICDDEAACSRAWRSAQAWIATNSRWKIQTVSDAVIVTFNGDAYTPFRHFQITREPVGGGKEQIKIASACNNTFGCADDVIVVAARFKRYVRAAM